MRRIILALGASAAIIVSFVMANGAAAAPVITGHGFSLSGSVAGGVTSAEFGQPLTFVFTEKNVGTVAKSEDLVLETLTNANLVSVGCVLPGGAQINPDGNDCEPGFLSHGKVASSVINVTVSSSSTGTVAARLCLSNEANGVVGPCLTRTVQLP